MRSVEFVRSELNFTAVVYSENPEILRHVQSSSQLPRYWNYQQKLASALEIFKERGANPCLNPDEQMVLDAILKERRLPAGAIFSSDESVYYTVDKPALISVIENPRRVYPGKIVKEKPGTPVVAETIRRILALYRKGELIDPWLEFPQYKCSFSFHKKKGKKKQGVPVGALMVLWHQDSRFTIRCPRCGQKAYGIAFGGLLSLGGIFFTCIGCDTCWFQQLGGLATMFDILKSSPLDKTAFRPSGCAYGGPYGSDGIHLLKSLGIQEKAEIF
jgi:hypothetical protein